jgi:8-oxo-dGTP diphosphatase
MRTLGDIDWTNWRAVDRATLVFVVQGDRVLLMHKKRGLGAGKINAPGGRLESGESPVQGAIREVQEELCVTPGELSKHGELSFQFVDGYSIFVHVFRAGAHSGTASETPEARPLWTSIEAIPYDRMWQDDALWVPHVLSERFFSGRFLFDGEVMLDHHLREHASAAALLDPDAPG